MNFEKVTRLSVPEEIITSIKQKIQDGELKPGDKLPSETKLAEMFGVGRGTVREAIKVMISLGFIERNSNRKTFISENAPQKVLFRETVEKFDGHRDLLEMIEVRKIIEPEAAALAAERCGSDLISKLESEYEHMSLNSGNPELFSEHDSQFHRYISSGTGNSLIISLMESIETVLIKGHLEVAKNSSVIKTKALKSHRDLLEALKGRDAKKAKRVMLSHILDVEKELNNGFIQEESPNS